MAQRSPPNPMHMESAKVQGRLLCQVDRNADEKRMTRDISTVTCVRCIKFYTSLMNRVPLAPRSKMYKGYNISKYMRGN